MEVFKMMIRLNKVANYANVADCYMIEDKSYMPKVINSETNREIPWTQSGSSPYSVHVKTKNGKGTNVALNVVQKAYEERHPF